jgi:hypothetical protein
MPFKSTKQRKYLYANKPEVAKRFASKQKAQANAIRKSAQNQGGGSIGGSTSA